MLKERLFLTESVRKGSLEGGIQTGQWCGPGEGEGRSR